MAGFETAHTGAQIAEASSAATETRQAATEQPDKRH